MRPHFLALAGCLLLVGLHTGHADACTSFCFKTPDGPIFATNFDYVYGEGLVLVNRRGIAKENFRSNPAGESLSWVSEYGSVTFNVAGRGFVWSGMNEAGLVISTMELLGTQYQAPDERAPFEPSCWVQYVLDTCRDVEEAIQVDAFVRLIDVSGSPGHFMVADAAGDCAVFEYHEGRFVYYTGEDLPVRALANAPYVAGPRYIEHGDLPAFNPGESVERVAAAVEWMEKSGSSKDLSSVDYSLGILSNEVVASKSFWSDWFNEPYTRWNIVYDIARREVHFRTVESPAARYFSLHSFDLSCEAPVLMLGVNAELQGSIDSAFMEYDHETNLEVFRSICDKLKLDLSEEDSVDLMRFIESFECSQDESDDT